MNDMSTPPATGLRPAYPSVTKNVCRIVVETIKDEDQLSRILIQVRQIVSPAKDHSGEQP